MEVLERARLRERAAVTVQAVPGAIDRLGADDVDRPASSRAGSRPPALCLSGRRGGARGGWRRDLRPRLDQALIARTAQPREELAPRQAALAAHLIDERRQRRLVFPGYVLSR